MAGAAFVWGVRSVASATGPTNASSAGSAFPREIDVLDDPLALRISIWLHDRIGQSASLPRFHG